MPVPVKIDLQHYRGDTLTFGMKVWADTAETVPADFSQATVAAQVRTTVDSQDVAGEFSVAISGQTLTLSLTAKETAVLGPANVWDCEVDWFGDESEVSTVVAGTLLIAADVTRELTP